MKLGNQEFVCERTKDRIFSHITTLVESQTGLLSDMGSTPIASTTISRENFSRLISCIKKTLAMKRCLEKL